LEGFDLLATGGGNDGGGAAGGVENIP